MPTYEFRCTDGHTFDRFFRKISDAPGDLECPVCGKVATRQLSAGAGLLFKGSGFYLTDYGKNAHRGGGGEKSGSSTSSPAETSGSDAKPAAAKPAESAGDSSKSTKSDASSSGSSSGASSKSES